MVDTDDVIATLTACTRPWQGRRGRLEPVPVPDGYDAAAALAKVLPRVPVATVSDLAKHAGMVELLDEARRFSVWIAFPRLDCVRQFLLDSRAGGRPLSLFAWLVRSRMTGYLTTMLPVAGAVIAGGAALLQGDGGHRLVWAIGLVSVAVAAVTLIGASPFAFAWWRHRSIRRIWLQATPGETLSSASRGWAQNAQQDQTIDDHRLPGLLAAAYFADIAAAWDRRLRLPVNWFRRWRREYPVLVVQRAGKADSLIEAYRLTPQRSAVLVLPRSAWPAAPVAAPVVSAAEFPWLLRRPQRATASLTIAAVAAAAFWLGLSAVTDECHGEDREVTEEAGEMIGLQTCGPPFLQTSATWEQAIYQENLDLPRHVADRQGRGKQEVLTVLLVTSLTQHDPNGSVMPESEALAGAYAAQRRFNDDITAHPIRLAIVNTGERGLRIQAALDEARDYIDEPGNRVVGAVVTVNSTSIAQEQLKEFLDAAGVAQISPTMTADRFGAAMTTFFQMISPNAQQAAMVQRYVRERAAAAGHPAAFFHVAPANHVEKSGDAPAYDDLYVQTLREDNARIWKTDPGADKFTDVTWADPSSDLSMTCARNDFYHVVYYGGRYTEFSEFIDDLRGECGLANMPEIIANDSVSRFLMDPRLAASVRSGVGVVIGARGPLLSCIQYDGTAGRLAAPRKDFVNDLHTYLRRCGSSSDAAGSHALAGGWTAGAYDALTLLGEAVRRVPGHENLIDGNQVSLLRAGMVDVLESNQMQNYGVVGRVLFDVNRVATRGTLLYSVPELRTAFDNGCSPADGSAVPLWKEGGMYEDSLDALRVDADTAAASCAAAKPHPK